MEFSVGNPEDDVSSAEPSPPPSDVGVPSPAALDFEAPASAIEELTSDPGTMCVPTRTSKYRNDFTELYELGRGGYGSVVLCQHKLDKKHYAVKKIPLDVKDSTRTDRAMREVFALSCLEDKYVIRYYQAWIERDVSGNISDQSSIEGFEKDSRSVAEQKPDCLYIQMEACAETLHSHLKARKFTDEWAWRCFRQIVEGLAHIHDKGVIHRDLTPNNIFFDFDGNAKIADFGLAHLSTSNSTEISDYGSPGVDIYVAPEIDSQREKINRQREEKNTGVVKKIFVNEKVDIYSLGCIFLELWSKFETGFERIEVMRKLKEGVLPSLVNPSEKKGNLLRKLTTSDPSDRPSASEIHQELKVEKLDDVLDAMDNAYQYTEMVKKIFSLDSTRAFYQHSLARDLERDDTLVLETDVREQIIEAAKYNFKKHGARWLEVASLESVKDLDIKPLALQDDPLDLHRNAVKLFSANGDMLQLPHELRLPFAQWILRKKKSSYRRYEISNVYKADVAHSKPNRYLQGEFDIVGEATSVESAALAIEVAMDIITQFLPTDTLHIHLNHYELLNAILCMISTKPKMRRVAHILSTIGPKRPKSLERERSWQEIKQSLLEVVGQQTVKKLAEAESKYCGDPVAALTALETFVSNDTKLLKAWQDLNAFLKLGRLDVEGNMFMDVFSTPTEFYYKELTFQIFYDDILVASGGSYDHLLENGLSACGVSVMLERIIEKVNFEEVEVKL